MADVDTIGELLEHHALEHPDAVAIADLTRPGLSYRGLDESTRRAAGALAAFGLGPGERVAIVLPNGPEMAVAFLAVTRVATAAPLNPGLTTAELAFYLADLDARAVTAGEAAETGVPAGDALVAFADATVANDPARIGAARERVLDALGPGATVDAAAVIGNFQRMVRIADGTGIPLDTPVSILTADLREELGIDGFASAGNTPKVTGLKRLLGKALQPLLFPMMKRFAPRRSR